MEFNGLREAVVPALAGVDPAVGIPRELSNGRPRARGGGPVCGE